MRSSKLVVVSPPVGEPVQRRRGRPPLPVVVHPAALWEVHDDPRDFHAALDLQIRRHGENSHRLHRAIVVAGGLTDRTTLAAWRRGLKVPQTPASLKVLDIIEHRYQLEAGYLRSRLQRRRALSGLVPPEVQYAESRRLAWHLPDDFDERSAEEQEEILAWVRSTILSGGTAYHRYHSTVSKHRFALRFDESGPSELAAPAQLRAEMDALLRFKSATLTDIGYQRSGVWGAETAAQREEHLALLFGALAALPDDEVSGLGVPREDLTFGLLVLPSVWDWYVQWRERRRGFFTGWESEMLLLAAALFLCLLIVPLGLPVVRLRSGPPGERVGPEGRGPGVGVRGPRLEPHGGGVLVVHADRQPRHRQQWRGGFRGAGRAGRGRHRQEGAAGSLAGESRRFGGTWA